MTKIKIPTLKTVYTNYKRVQFIPKGKSLTRQSHKEECDINVIIGKFEATGQVPLTFNQNPQFGDFSEVSDYQTSLNTVLAAEEAFMSLSAAIRKRFSNDPALYLDFVSNPANRDEMEKLGLLAKKEVFPTQSVEPNPSADSPPVGKSKLGKDEPGPVST